MQKKIRSWPRWLRWGIVYSLGPIITLFLALATAGYALIVGMGFYAPLLLFYEIGLDLGFFTGNAIATLIWFLIGALIGKFVSARYSNIAIVGSVILYIMLYAFAFYSGAFIWFDVS